MFSRHSLSVTFLFVLIAAVSIEAQSNGDPLKACEARTASYPAWAECVIETVATPIVNQRHPAKQVEVPSIADNTTSLVDQTTAPDIPGLALNFAGLTSGTGENGNGSGTITTSAYALYALVTKNEPLDPAFYVKHPDLRRFSFSFGLDNGDEAAEKPERATLAGFKTLLLNGREVSRTKNRQRLRTASNALANQLAPTLTIHSKLQDYLYRQLSAPLGFCGNPPTGRTSPLVAFLNSCLGPALQTTIAALSPEQRKEIETMVAAEIDERANFMATVSEQVWKIRRAPQLSLSFQSKLRNNNGDDEYRTGLLFDYGLYERLNLTLNGTFDYKDSQTIGGDTRSGRFAAEGIFWLGPRNSSFGEARPWLLSTSAEAKWSPDEDSTYTGQVKLTIPVPKLTGVNFPISFSVANRSELIKEKVVRGRFGFTIDLTKLISKTP